MDEKGDQRGEKQELCMEVLKGLASNKDLKGSRLGKGKEWPVKDGRRRTSRPVRKYYIPCHDGC